MQYFLEIFLWEIDRKRKSSTSLLPTDSMLANTKNETRSPCGTFPDTPFERSCEDNSGADRLLQQILKQGKGDQLLPFFRSSPSTADEGAVWPGDMTWFCYSKERVPEGTWICRLKSVEKSASHLLCKQRQVSPSMFLKRRICAENLSIITSQDGSALQQKLPHSAFTGTQIKKL